MSRFKKVALKKNKDRIVDDLFHYEEALNHNSNDLDLSKVNIYLHQVLNLTGLRLFQVKLFYGRIAEDGSF